MKYTVDRIVSGIAVLEKEDLSHIEVPVSSLPEGTKEGSVLLFDGSVYSFDFDEEAERKRQIAEKQKLIFKKSKKD